MRSIKVNGIYPRCLSGSAKSTDSSPLPFSDPSMARSRSGDPLKNNTQQLKGCGDFVLAKTPQKHQELKYY